MEYTKEKTLEALTHCINFDNPFAEKRCNKDCPYAMTCGQSPADIIMEELRKLLIEYIPADRSKIPLETISRCFDKTHELCNNTCHYWNDCHDDNIAFLFRDIYRLFVEFGLYET